MEGTEELRLPGTSEVMAHRSRCISFGKCLLEKMRPVHWEKECNWEGREGFLEKAAFYSRIQMRGWGAPRIIEALPGHGVTSESQHLRPREMWTEGRDMPPISGGLFGKKIT